MKQSFKHIALSVSFLMLFVGYQICITSFTHVHYVNGVMITHSHPYAGDGHSHQKADFSLIAQLTHFSALNPEFIIYNHIVWPVGGIVSVCPKADALPTNDACYYSLRAPPVVQV